MKKVFAILMVLCMCIGLCACGKSKEAKKADELILSIGTVSIESETLIKTAQTYYDTLTEKQKAEVENYALLVQAQENYSKIATRIEAESAIEEAYADEEWVTVLTLTKEYLATYPNEKFISKAKEYKEESIDTIESDVIANLKAGELETGKMLLEVIEEDVDGADDLLAEIEENIAIAGVYIAKEYSRKKNGMDLPFQGTRESYKLTASPFMNNDGKWEVKYTVEVPGIFNLAGKGCFTYTCVGVAHINGNVAVAIELNPQIDTWNTSIIKEDVFRIFSTDDGYLAMHDIYYKSGGFEEITQKFVKK